MAEATRIRYCTLKIIDSHALAPEPDPRTNSRNEDRKSVFKSIGWGIDDRQDALAAARV